MKKLAVFILIISLVFSFFACIPVSARNAMTAEGEQEERDEKNDPQPIDVYYITQEEFEKYRDDYFAEKAVSLSNNLRESFLLFPAGLATPLLLPILIFIPWGGFVVATVLTAPYIVTTNLFTSIKETINFNTHRDELYNSFSADDLYALPEYAYDETYSEITGINYFITVRETGGELPANAILVAIKSS